MPHLIEVAFRGNRKDFFLWDQDDAPPLNSAVIVDADRGEDLGFVHALGELAEKRNAGTPHGYGSAGTSKKVRRLATADEAERSAELKAQNEDARRRAMERVKANDLVMKLSDAEWQWDRKKLTFYFTAEKRVDFRTLVRELASMFRTRIELKQIGVRDEAKRLDGIGRCGRQYCSSSWLPELRPVNLGVAKDQRLSLNPSQISGACGRLMCCLRYEHEFYVLSRKRFPKEGKIIRTTRGEEKVISNDIFRERVTLRGEDGELRVILLAELRAEAESAGAPLPVTATHAVMATDVDEETDIILDDDLKFDPALSEADSRAMSERTQMTGEHTIDLIIQLPIEVPPDVAGDESGENGDDDGDEGDNGEPTAGENGQPQQADGERRPHRRRGRRGGRRNRPGGGSRGPTSGSTNEPPPAGES
jgi:cell fate regulator YaaT (PSP1 superfamily)